MSALILPGAAIGVLGSGQLGRMLALAARQMGYRVHVLSPDADSPTGQVADVEVVAPYEDVDAVRAFASRVSVVTFEFENVPAASAEAAAAVTRVRPSGAVLQICQQRIREKTFLRDAGLPVPQFCAVSTQEELLAGLGKVGGRGVLKTAAFGYDGKGQSTVATTAEALAAWKRMGRVEAILEAFVDFEREVSVVGARGEDGSFAHWGVFDNVHSRHILDVTLSPAPVEETVAREAVEIARTILEKLDVVGVLCTEMFVTRKGSLLVNELAPRTHNSGHLTLDAHVTSQFEQQLRAVCGLPLGSTEQLRPAAMVNLLGDLWEGGEPDWATALALPDVKLHLYGKAEARPGRKMGHLTAFGPTVERARECALAARAVLTARRDTA